MKLLIASDIHGAADWCGLLINAIESENPDRIVLLGDLLYHGPRNDIPADYAPKRCIEMLNSIAPQVIAVRGNCDAEVDQMVLDFPCMADYAIVFGAAASARVNESASAAMNSKIASVIDLVAGGAEVSNTRAAADAGNAAMPFAGSSTGEDADMDTGAGTETVSDEGAETAPVAPRVSEAAGSDIPNPGSSEYVRTTPSSVTIGADISGDTDTCAMSPRILTACPRELFLTHGHVYGPGVPGSIDNMPALPKGSALVYGHTHRKVNRASRVHPGIWLFNPGSVGIPKDGSHSYGIYQDGVFTHRILERASRR